MDIASFWKDRIPILVFSILIGISTNSQATEPPPSSAAKRITLEGTLYEKGTKVRLKDVNIYLLPYKLKATTNDQGNFSVEGVPEGKFSWVVNLTGYQRLE